jgi:glycosyltransferase involved in cell wall biosynthesis
MKVAIVYDRVNKWGGAERVLLHLHEMFPDAPLYTSVYSKENAKWAEVFPKIHTSFLQKIPFTKRRHEMLPLFMPLAFESMDFDQYDLVISVTSEAAKGVITKGKTKHICYCLTPTRYLWSGHDTYFKNRLIKSLGKPYVAHLRRWDKMASARPDEMVGISTEVKNRIKSYYGRESRIVFPPTEIEKFTKINDNDGNGNGGKKVKLPKDYFLVVSRLVPYKKVDLVVETFNELGLPLVIIGAGNQEKKLKRIANKNVQFIKDATDNELIKYYAHAKGFIFPQEEDFGLVAVEAQAAGVPVIAFNKGGSLDTVIHGKTGVFFEEQRKESLMDAISSFSNLSFLRKDIIHNARRFSKEKFKKDFLTVVGKYF